MNPIQPGDDVTSLKSDWFDIGTGLPVSYPVPIEYGVYTVRTVGPDKQFPDRIVITLAEFPPRFRFVIENFRKVNKPTFDFREKIREPILASR